MLTSVRLVNFKSHVDTTIELGRLTILVGPNACGKTSVLDAIELMSDLATRSPLEVLGGRVEGHKSVVRQGCDAFELHAEGPDVGLSLRVPLLAFKETSKALVTRTIKSNGSRQKESILVGARPPHVPDLVDLLSVRYLEPSAAHLAAPSQTKTLPPGMERTGYGLASLLAHLKLSEEETFEHIVADLRAVLPRVASVRIDRDLAGGGMREVVLLDFVDARGIRAELVSSGTMLVLGILTAVHLEPKARVLLLDDVEQGLHPRAQVDLLAALRRVLEARPEVQIVATSHSPYLLDEVEVGEVRVMATDSSGVSHAAKLSAHPDAAHALRALGAGELFSADSEEWVLAVEGERA